MSFSKGTYVSGFRFDWDEAQKDEHRFREAGRPNMAAACADPGCCTCETCGETHMAEYEVFLCGRCGAECQMLENHKVVSGKATKPEMVRTKMVEGMRVRYNGRTQFRGKLGPLPGCWPTGNVPPGSVGTLHYNKGPWGLRWEINFPGIVPKEGYVFGAGLMEPFLDDDFEIL